MDPRGEGAEAREGRGAGEYRLESEPAGDTDVVCGHEPMDRHRNAVDPRNTASRIGPPIEVRRRVHVTPGLTTTVDFAIVADDRK